MATKEKSNVTQEGTLGDADVTSRTREAGPGAGQVWPEVHTHEQADAQAAERGITWPETPNKGPEGNLTVQQKQAILNGADFDWSKKSGMR